MGEEKRKKGREEGEGGPQSFLKLYLNMVVTNGSTGHGEVGVLVRGKTDGRDELHFAMFDVAGGEVHVAVGRIRKRERKEKKRRKKKKQTRGYH